MFASQALTTNLAAIFVLLTQTALTRGDPIELTTADAMILIPIVQITFILDRHSATRGTHRFWCAEVPADATATPASESRNRELH